MIRTNVYLTKQEKQGIEKLAKQTGLSAADIIRRAIDEYLEKQGAKQR